MLAPVLVAYAILSFHHAHGLAQGLGGSCDEPQGASLTKEVARREAKNAFNEKAQPQKETEQAWSATYRAV
jgi:hypothetical protein